ncbi:sensor histidine kinase [Paenibacillus azoreducens]|uniref:histidine kinase n=1 Tax=Paenibacillus azoreducens TaxID=116718 RepID=A0A919YCH2_9BACL|nr:histidine kinase [Paenibacillus azoreducens]GIO48199.1 sensor histidine kinase [Paenibacillus azoreducens]
MDRLSSIFLRTRRMIVPTSLKRKLVYVLLLSTFIPLLLIGIISYTSMHTILEKKITSGIHSNLKQVRVSLENVLGNLNYASQQLAFDGRVGKDIYAYMTNDHPYDRKILAGEIETEMNLLTSTNPNIGLMFYYDQGTNRILFPNLQVREGFDSAKLPVFTKLQGMTYYGPHQTLNAQFDRKVMSITRKIDFPDLEQLYIYMETDNRLVDTVFNKMQYGMEVYHLIVDTDNRIAYSEKPSSFPIGMKLATHEEDANRAVYGTQYMFEEASNQGWRVAAVIPMQSYKHEIFNWFLQFGAIAVLSLFVSLGFAWLIWRIVTRPLTSLNREIRLMAQNQSQGELQLTGTDEFDYSLRRFHEMKGTVIQLIEDIKENERNKSRLEVEKMISQINPHFVHNTLDTIRWQARLNGQEDIDHLISTLNRVLHYNLGKGETATIREELAALKDYITLQEIRYQFHFDIRISVPQEQLELRIPRFMLQPLVENALYHGIADDGLILVDISQEAQYIRIEVSDNGAGMSPEEADRLLQGDDSAHKRRGMGIGMPYVIRTLKYQYGESAGIDIESRSGEGTSIIITIPSSTLGRGDQLHARIDC